MQNLESRASTSAKASGEFAPDCRFCAAPLQHVFADLGSSPLCNKQIHPHELNDAESFYPLCAFVCERCFLVQLGEFVAPDEIFGFYHYFSSYSDSWLAHAERYVQMAVQRFGLGDGHQVAEIASNDGYLLQYFVRRGIRAFGIEPAGNVAEAARKKGIDTISRFFGAESAKAIAAERGQVDLLIGNNVLAHVPDLNDFVSGIPAILTPGGQVTLEFPHLVRLVEENQFDTIYHEHFSYFSFTTVEKVLAAHGISVFDVEQLQTHGGSLRIFGCHAGAGREVGPAVAALRASEAAAGVLTLDYYASFAERVRVTKRKLLAFLIEAANAGKTVAGYGAPGKGNTLLNYCGIRTDLLQYTVDRNPMKAGTFLPGTRIPVYTPDRLRETRPDYVLILPWNLKDEVMQQMADVRGWGGRFVVPIPEVKVY